MKRSSGHLLRFIDLGLLLLLAFLSVAELNPTLQVQLPGRSNASRGTAMARIVFDHDWNASVQRLDNSKVLCKTSSIGALEACMTQQAHIRFLLAPVNAATVQQIVTLLDACTAAALPCVIEAIPE
ncbi:MAG: hypothetical protein F4146_05250 [Rhodothermaceae bacterium]|nr:hypothetical protein [Rhodothermaceae bacterium]MXZ05802.1 hypothetical protein [Rhodothermaceae bacterium]MYF41080.1 hypothetical protein [Rhodothermaceae bacterium]MYH07945.1 hypothetical protein [Rhodothermaceae bacterium]